MTQSRLTLLIAVMCAAGHAFAQGFEPLGPVLSAHNCYPYHGMWADRIDRALETGVPLAIEQDLCWAKLPGADEKTSVVAHNGPFNGHEPTLDAYFFERVRPIVERTLERAKDHASEKDRWPLLVLDLDVKHNTRPHAEAIHALLRRYAAEGWLSSAAKTSRDTVRSPVAMAPILVLGGDGAQRTVFYERVPEGEPFYVFGRARVDGPDTTGMPAEARAKAVATYPAERMVSRPATNYERWWNNSWYAVEAGGAPSAGEWTPAENERLRELVDHAHELGYWIRFYTINGHDPIQGGRLGIGGGYNTGSLERAQTRWRAMLEAGVDFIATDQYRAFAAFRESMESGKSGDE